MTIGSWTNGDVTITHVIREGQITESFHIKDAPATRRQRGQGDFEPHSVVMHFSISGETWQCLGAQVVGPLLRKDGTLSRHTHKASWYGFVDYPDTEAPAWLVHLARCRLAVVKYVPAKAPDDGTWP